MPSDFGYGVHSSKPTGVAHSLSTQRTFWSRQEHRKHGSLFGTLSVVLYNIPSTVQPFTGMPSESIIIILIIIIKIREWVQDKTWMCTNHILVMLTVKTFSTRFLTCCSEPIKWTEKCVWTTVCVSSIRGSYSIFIIFTIWKDYIYLRKCATMLLGYF